MHVMTRMSRPTFSMNKECKRTGAVVEVIPSDESGELDVAALEGMLSAGGVKAVAVTHVPTNGGVVNPAREGADESISHGLERGTIRLRERRPLQRTPQALRHLHPHRPYRACRRVSPAKRRVPVGRYARRDKGSSVGASLYFAST